MKKRYQILLVTMRTEISVMSKPQTRRTSISKSKNSMLAFQGQLLVILSSI